MQSLKVCLIPLIVYDIEQIKYLYQRNNYENLEQAVYKEIGWKWE